jgi:hypothetical protein
MELGPLVKRAALTGDLRSGHQHYAGEPALVPGTNPGIVALGSCVGLDHRHTEALRRPQLAPLAGAVSSGTVAFEILLGERLSALS